MYMYKSVTDYCGPYSYISKDKRVPLTDSAVKIDDGSFLYRGLTAVVRELIHYAGAIS